MTEENAHKFLECLGIDYAELHGDWVRSSCPLAFSRHKGGKDSNPSFGVFHNPIGASGYHCFSCNLHGKTLDGLLSEFHFLALNGGGLPAGINLPKAYEIVEAENEIGYHDSEWTGGITDAKNQFEAWPLWWLESFPLALKFPEATKYLAGRGINASASVALDLRYDTKKRTVCFPIRNHSKKLAGMRGRFLKPVGDFRFYDYKWNDINNTSLVLLGEDRVDWMKPVVVTEGIFDHAVVYAHAYRNTVCNLTTSLSKQKVAKMESAIELIGVFDDDVAGTIATKLLAERFPGAYTQVDWERLDKFRKAPDDLSDPGACNRVQIRELLAPYVKLDEPL